MTGIYEIKLAECGTLSAYRRHRRRDEDCATCRTAWAQYYRHRARDQRNGDNVA